MANNHEENLGPMKLIFNYNNVFFSFFYDDLSGCIHRSREYALNYVYSGEMISTTERRRFTCAKVNVSLFRATITLQCIRKLIGANGIAVSF